ncbi:MAG: sel1 repeat family protein, partial [Succinivibrionaceae bacterium]|nr:sel1 repeat family protein [Succinivibrionaceae bacterium]
VRQDYAEALKWYKKSAEKGCMLAQTAIGLMYMEGRGVRQDLKEARTWLERASGKDSREA